MEFELEPRLKVSVDRDLCSSCGNCVAYAPEVFVHVDGLSFVRDGDRVASSNELVEVPKASEQNVIVAAQECPGEIIYLTYL